jgi:hypothetical protein
VDKKKQKALEANGWVVGSVSELLGLSAEETLLMELHADWAQAISRSAGQAPHQPAAPGGAHGIDAREGCPMPSTGWAAWTSCCALWWLWARSAEKS